MITLRIIYDDKHSQVSSSYRGNYARAVIGEIMQVIGEIMQVIGERCKL